MSDLADAIKKAADALAQLASQIEETPASELSDAELGKVAGGIGGSGYADHGDHHDVHGDIG